MEEQCGWHKTADCLNKAATLVLEQTLSPPSEREEFQEALQSTDRVFGSSAGVLFYQQLGQFCTTSALLSWLEANTGAMKQHTRELHGSGPGAKRGKGNINRPVVTREGRRRQR